MLKASIKNKIPFILLLFWSYSASARDLFEFNSMGSFILFFLSWIAISISGIFIFKSLKEKYGKISAFKYLNHFFHLSLAAFFFIILWLYLYEDSSNDSLIDEIMAEEDFEMKIACLILGSITLLIAIFVIWKDYKKR